MKLLVTSDLHLVRLWRSIVLTTLAQWVREVSPDALVVAGDVAVATEADTVLRELRRVFPDGPIIVALGNHDFWGGVAAGCRTLGATVERFWQVPAERYQVTLLDQDNFCSEELTFVGGYGHYDLGFAAPGLRYQGQMVTQEHYLRGRPPIENPLRWRDFDLMPGAAEVLSIAHGQVQGVRSRILAAGSQPIFVVLHTPPFEELLGVPDASLLDPESPPIRAFFRAYLGNRAMGEMLRLYSERIAGIVCGHTHRAAGPVDLGGFAGFNVGSDYGVPRGFVVDTKGSSMGISSITELMV
ncbi:MAG: metallophosphoesterase [Verrucomicrobia bacterium]|nr:metallophosphoesterase [Verrucomicrobiota bacterium]